MAGTTSRSRSTTSGGRSPAAAPGRRPLPLPLRLLVMALAFLAMVAFGAETGHSPARAVEQLRVEAARVLLEQGRLQMDVIAREVGLVDRERMRRAFVRTLGQPPRTVRRAWRAGHSEQEDLADG